MSNDTPAEALQRAMDERALIVRALRALRNLMMPGDDQSLGTMQAMARAIASDPCPPDVCAKADALECIAVLSDPLAVELMKEADRG